MLEYDDTVTLYQMSWLLIGYGVCSWLEDDDVVILITHEPNWLLDWYWDAATGTNVTYLIQQHLKGRCKIRFAGDLHFYSRHSAKLSSSMPAPKELSRSLSSSSVSSSLSSSSSVPPSLTPPSLPLYEHLVVNGAGGAFMHPTHVFEDFDNFVGARYERQAAYPSIRLSRTIGLLNILKFRAKNWRFDVVGGIAYFLAVFSMFPQCNLDSIFDQEHLRGRAREFFNMECRAFRFMLEESYVSIIGTLVFLGLAIYFVPTKLGRKRRIALGMAHWLTHLLAAFALMLMLELGVEVCVRHKLLGTAGYHTLYEWYQSKQMEHFPDPTRLRSRMEVWTFGFYPACVKYLMSAFDVPETMAVTRNRICKEGMQALPRGFQVLYYVCVFLYYWVFSTPVVSLVMGCYLYICINWLHIHFDEAFSSLRIAHYKSFMRCHITSDGLLEVFVLAVDKVPRDWSIDPSWVREQESSAGVMPHKLSFPSKWIPSAQYGDKQCNVRIVDHFMVDKKAMACPKPRAPVGAQHPKTQTRARQTPCFGTAKTAPAAGVSTARSAAAFTKGNPSYMQRRASSSLSPRPYSKGSVGHPFASPCRSFKSGRIRRPLSLSPPRRMVRESNARSSSLSPPPHRQELGGSRVVDAAHSAIESEEGLCACGMKCPTCFHRHYGSRLSPRKMTNGGEFEPIPALWRLHSVVKEANSRSGSNTTTAGYPPRAVASVDETDQNQVEEDVMSGVWKSVYKGGAQKDVKKVTASQVATGRSKKRKW